MKPVIHIFGASGSGTTTLGRALAEALSLRHMDTDDYFWLPTDPPFTQKRPVPERLALMQRDIDAAPGAVISGSLTGWGNPLMTQFTLAIRVVTETALRLERLHDRELRRFGERILPGGDMHEEHQAFLDWAARYDTGDASMRSQANHDLWQRQLTCPLLYVDGSAPPEATLAQVLEAAPDGCPPPQLQHIAAMESAMDRALPAVETLSAALDAYEAILPQLHQLTAYMDSGEWLQDYLDDNAGHIPQGMKRGVLSQDALYDLVCDHLRLLRRMQELGKSTE